jgi:hypothetical protein
MMRRLKLWWLQRNLKRSDKVYSKYVAEAEGKQQQSRISEAMSVREGQRDAILTLRSVLLSDEADSLGIPVPPFSDKQSWEDGRIPGTARLKLKAQSQLLQAIRNEHREKWSTFTFMMKEIVTPLIGILGAIMGLLSIIHAFRSK